MSVKSRRCIENNNLAKMFGTNLNKSNSSAKDSSVLSSSIGKSSSSKSNSINIGIKGKDKDKENQDVAKKFSYSSSLKIKGDIGTTGSTESDTTTVGAAAQTAATNKETIESPTDKFKKFENEGVIFKAKLIGTELVIEPRGDKMCQNSIQRLKAIIKGTNSHKRRITLKISYDGVKVSDEKTNELLHHHEVSQISYIAGDETDSRTFGYVSDVPNKAHQFICFKTSGPAINVMSVISGLFEAVLELKNQQSEKDKQPIAAINDSVVATATKVNRQDSVDLIGDSGIMDGDLSMISSASATTGNLVNQAGITKGRGIGGDILDKNSSTMLDGLVMASSPGDSYGATPTNISKSKPQSTVDLIFDDLFTGLTDPIIVDKNDSLISYKGNFGKGAPDNSSITCSTSYGTNGGGNMISSNQSLNNSGMSSTRPSQQPSISSNLDSSANNIKALLGDPFSFSDQYIEGHLRAIPPRQPGTRPIPKRQNSTPASSILQPPASLPRPAPTFQSSMGPSAQAPNRSLVYNHSSVSLSDAALTRQSSFNMPQQSHLSQQLQQQHQQQQVPARSHSVSTDPHVDRYAVFNDIDNLPSIFESSVAMSTSTTSISANNINANTNTNVFRQTNPFNDDFFA